MNKEGSAKVPDTRRKVDFDHSLLLVSEDQNLLFNEVNGTFAEPSEIAIIGGGAAGMMAAATILEKSQNHKVFLIEKNAILGRKVIISGGGRCNVTTGINDLPEILQKYPRGSKFLKSALYDFPPKKVCQWFEDHGVPLKTEKDLRVFPKSNNGKDVVGVFENILNQSSSEILLKTSVQNITKNGHKFSLSLSDNKTLEVDKLIITTGGQAYRHTGSQGDGYKFAEKLGHKITRLAPGLNAFVVKENWVKHLAGVAFKNVRLRLKQYQFTGPIMFTHKGLTGPAVFVISSFAAFENIGKNNHETLHIDFCPHFNYEQLNEQINNNIKKEPQKLFLNILSNFIPKSLAKIFFQFAEINLSKQNHDLGKKDLNKIIELLKNTQITLIDQTSGEEFVTAGGVELSEVSSKNMQSKICPELYFAGEILNIDGFTGGFNLQAAWSTGYLAGKSACI